MKLSAFLAGLIVVGCVAAIAVCAAIGAVVPIAVVLLAIGALSGQFALLHVSSTLSLVVAAACVLAVLALVADGITKPPSPLLEIAVGALVGHFVLPGSPMPSPLQESDASPTRRSSTPGDASP